MLTLKPKSCEKQEVKFINLLHQVSALVRQIHRTCTEPTYLLVSAQPNHVIRKRP